MFKPLHSLNGCCFECQQFNKQQATIDMSIFVSLMKISSSEFKMELYPCASPSNTQLCFIQMNQC